MRRLKKVVTRLAALGIASVIMAAGVPADGSTSPARAKVGFTFIARYAARMGIEPNYALNTLLYQLQPDVVRLPVYWSDAEPEPDRWDFSVVDSELQVINEYNVHHFRHVNVILVAGVRNLGYPEVFAPSWLESGPAVSADMLTDTADYVEYLRNTILHFLKLRNLQAWQIENEPLDDVPDTQLNVLPEIDKNHLASSIDLAHQLDPHHQVVITTYDSAALPLDLRFMTDPRDMSKPAPAGHPQAALATGDILGLDAYVIVSDRDAASEPAPVRIEWKAQEMLFWDQQAKQQGKNFWIMEMQGEPFSDTHGGFEVSDMLNEAQLYRASDPQLVLLWGMGTWLKSADWMKGALQAMDILRS